MEEPTIIVIIKADHYEGLHEDDPNKYCPICMEEILTIEIEDYLKDR